MLNNYRVGIQKIPLHLVGFGIPFGLIGWFGGWGTAVVLVSWRAYAEYQDWKGRSDTLGKALIDFGSQVILTIGVVIAKNSFGS